MSVTPDELLDRRQLAAHHAGDASAGRNLYRRHFGRVRRYFANKACQPADVEDLVSRTFELLFSPTSKAVDADRFAAYLLGIARHVWFAHLRDRLRKTWAHAPEASSPEGFERLLANHGLSLRALGAGMTSVLEHEERLRKLLDALRELPVIQQEALELHYWEDMTYEELASVLRAPVGTVKGRVRLAKVRLYQAMSGSPVATDDRTTEEVIAQVDAWASRVACRIRAATRG